MQRKETSLLVRLSAMLLVAVMLATGGFLPFGPAAYAAPDSTGAQEQAPSALTKLLRQTKGLEDSTTLSLLVQLSEDADAYRGVENAEVYSAEALRDDANRDAQAQMAARTQDEVLEIFRSKGIDFKLAYRLDLLTNGLTGTATLADAKKIAELPQIKSVEVMVEYAAPTVDNMKSMMNNSVKIVHSGAANGRGYDGRGAVIAVLDTGADPAHQDMVLEGEDAVGMRWSKETIDTMVGSGGAIGHGKWFSNKIPFGYHYALQNDSIKDKERESHGMHVAGTILANGDPEKGGIRGIAPKAQLLAMNVFSPLGGTSGALYLPAIEDAIKLGADSINMSLGAPAGVVTEPGTDINLMIEKAAQIGCVINIAAGNESQFGAGASNPRADEPDYAVVGTPAVERGSLAVASMNNLKVTLKSVELVGRPEGDEHRFAPYQEGAIVPLDGVYDKSFEFVDCGIGRKDQIPDDVKGKAALIERGELTFAEKVNNVAEKGAVMAIIYNHEAGGDDFVGMAVDGTKIPSLSIKRSDGLYLKNEYEGQIIVRSKAVASDYGTAGQMSDFSSWGLASNGDMKPEITAPGGNIYSTLNDNTYGSMSGTSMATPHVAGGTALVSAYIHKAFPSVTGTDKAILMKNLLMSTAVPHVDREDKINGDIYTSPRRQGAGVMDLDAATTGSVIVVGKDEGFGKGISKVVLGDLSSDSFSVNVTLLNYGKTPVSFQGSYQLATDEVEDGFMTLRPRFLAGEKAGSVEVPAATEQGPGSADFSVAIDASAFGEELAGLMPNGYFLEGFVLFKSMTDGQPDVSIPYVGFRGSWDDLTVLEKPIYEFKDLANDKPIYYDTELGDENVHFTHFYSAKDGKLFVLGETTVGDGPRTFDGSHIALSPNKDYVADQIGFRGVFTRNYYDFQVKVMKDETEIAAFPSAKAEGKKNHYSSNPKWPKSTTYGTWTWDATDSNGSIVPDGKYELRIEGKAVTVPKEAPANALGSYTLWIDTVAPIQKGTTFDKETGVLRLGFSDGDGCGIKEYAVTYNGEPVPAEADGSYKLPKDADLEEVQITVTDYALNAYAENLKEIVDPSPRAKLNVVAKTTDGSAAPEFTYELFRVKNGKETPVKLAQDYKVGTYKLVVKSWEGHFLLAERTQTVELAEEGKTYEVSFTFEPDSRSYGKLVVTLFDVIGYPGNREFVFINNETKEEFTPKSDDSQEVFYAEVPYGTYTIRPLNVDADYRALPEEAVATVDEKSSYVSVPFNFMKRDQFGSIIPDMTAGDPDLSVDGIEFEYIDLVSQVDQGRGIDIPVGLYFVAPKNLPEGTFVWPNFEVVNLTKEDNEQHPKFTLYKKTPERTGSIRPVLVKKDASYPDLQVEYDVYDFRDNKMDSLENLCYGTYYLKVRKQPKGYQVYPTGDDSSFDADSVQVVSISPENKNPEASFTALALADMDMVGNFYITVRMPEDFPNIPLTVEITGVRAKAQSMTINSMYGMGYYANFYDVPYDDYTVTVKGLPEGYYLDPPFGECRVVTPLKNNLQLAIKAETVSVTFDPCNGEDPTVVEVVKGKTVAPADAPALEGYAFKGWYTEDGKQFDFATPVTADLALHAEWTAKTYDVTLDYNDGRPVSIQTVKHGELVARPENPTREHFDFAGWTKDAEGTTAFDFDSEYVTEPLTIYAQWVRHIYEVTLVLPDNTASTQNVEYEGHIAFPELTLPKGKILKGWFIDGDEAQPFNPETPVSGPLKLQAILMDDPDMKRGFYMEEDGLHYYDPQTGEEYKSRWADIDSETYCFDDNGVAVMGLQQIGDDIFYFEEKGCTLQRNRWKTSDAYTYYLGENGAALRGAHRIGRELYYFDPEYAVQIKNSWKEIGENTYYFNPYGPAYKGLREIGGQKYYFDLQTGAQLKGGWKTVGGNTYYFNQYGPAYKGLRTISGVLFYFDPQTGVQFKDGWQTIQNKTYHFNAYGVAAKGLRRIGGNLHYFDENTGVQYKNLWKVLGDKTYYFNQYGAAYTGLRIIDGVVFGFAPDGVQYKSCTVKVDGKLCTFNKYGVLVN